MVKIAICDDEEKAVALHERIVKACLQSQGIGYEITTYTQSRNLLYDITDDGFFYDLILLDIEMPGISGMEIPQQLKGFLPNVRIIFVTSHTEYAIDAFELSIFRYVPKNNLEVKLATAVTDAAKLIELEAGQEYTCLLYTSTVTIFPSLRASVSNRVCSFAVRGITSPPLLTSARLKSIVHPSRTTSGLSSL